MLSKKWVLTLIIAIFCCSLSYAKAPFIRDIGPIDEQFMANQTTLIDDLSRRYLGRQINGSKANDIEVMQLLLDKSLVRPEQTLELQAMGVILGNLIKEQEKLKWVVYTDRLGRSKALLVPHKEDVIFPVTMISRRVETGNKVDINALFNKAIDEVERIRRKIIVR